MKIKIEKLLFLILCAIILVGILSCEQHIHEKFYLILQLVALILILLFLLLFYKLKDEKKGILKRNINKNLYMIILFSFMIIISIINSIINSSIKGLIYTIIFMFSMIVLAFVVPTYLNIYTEYINKLLKYITTLSVFVSIIGICIYYFRNFLGYTLVDKRVASIFFDPNFFATFVAVGTISSLSIKKKIYRTIFIINVYAIILSGSRGALLSLAIVCVIAIILNDFSIKKLLLGILLLVIFFVGAEYLNEIGFFRTYQGSSGRFDMITYLWNPIKASPVLGYGYGATKNLLQEGNFNNASSHNSLVDFIVGYGIPCGILFVYVLIKSVIKGLKKQRIIFLINLLLIINSNTILYNIGGVGMCSVLWTIFFGMNIAEVKSE